MTTATYNAAQIAELLGISVTGAYQLLHREGFPTLRIGRRLLVTKENLERWIEIQSTPAASA